MKIIQVSNSDIQGGAARAAYRLHQGLIELQQDSQMLTLEKRSLNNTVTKLDNPPIDPHSIHLSHIQNRYINQNRSPLSNTSFTLPYPGIDLTHIPADIINLHWVAYFQSPVTIHHSLNQKPVIWTLHDMWAFTGGCHYSAGCTQYQQDCAHCPQLNTDPHGITAAILNDRLDLLSNTPLVIVTPSQWLADCARKSRVLKNQRIEVIPYSLETDIFTPTHRPTAKQELGIANDPIALLIGADNGNEQRKGFAELLEALKICLRNPRFQALITAQKLQLWVFGIPNDRLTDLDIPLHAFGTIHSDRHLSQIYAAADLFLLPSLEDNFPNTMLESMSCGTPVIAFHIGGIPDVVKDGVTGRTVPIGDVAAMAAAILDCVFDEALRSSLGQASREVMAEQYALTIQAQRYLELYEDVIQKPRVDQSPTLRNRISQRNPISSPRQEIDRAPTSMGKSFEQVFYPLALELAAEELQKVRQQVKKQEARAASQIPQGSQAEIRQLRDRLTAIETSKFWKLRSAWFKLKRWLGLSAIE
jgi:glycosyltransferase involved in cell wall biosynthesis